MGTAGVEAIATTYTAILDGLVLAWLIDPRRVDPAALAPLVAKLLWQGVLPAVTAAKPK